MPPFQELFTSTEFWTAVILALLGGGGIGGIVGAWANKDKTEADIDNIAAEAARKIQETLGATVESLRTQVDYQEQQIEHLEKVQRKYFTAVGYTRRLFHWLQDFCELAEPEFLARHPKPNLPDELRPDIAPETIGKE
ncbi:PRTRC system protein E [Bifidobacterium platyrrhinorum]|uniref:PRTRC system protein E n=1 Tax=Bifidobacterium platyrrhinorum TaxID=2661628 RepID=A0A6L9SSB8_9BIFI|nr:PRTRC system protein E [Bifidobacterium platyrrhinorum]NEG55476.1 PRTRC system protein E [Bifidobacterium platyrrhinorum]